MMRRMSRTLAVFMVLGFIPVTVSAKGWCNWKSFEEMCAPGWKAGNYHRVWVPAKWKDWLMANKGFIETGTYYKDKDQDGFGRAGSKARACPRIKRADNDLDCNDKDANVNPDAEEICDNGVDDSCSGEVDDCASATCPCFAAADIAAAYQDFAAVEWDSSELICEDWTFVEETYFYDWAKLSWDGSLTQDGVTIADSALFYGIDYEDGGAGTLCIRSKVDTALDDTTGEYVSYEEDYYEQPLTPEEHQACVGVILDYAASAGIQCVETTYP